MKPLTLNRQQCRELDRRANDEYGVPSIVLMENAGRGVADKLCQFGIDGRVVILCGPGNNGGDGYVIARHLDLRGVPVQLIEVGAPSRRGDADEPSDAAINRLIAQRAGLPLVTLADAASLPDLLQGASWVVDALLGTGSQGEPREPFAAVINAINQAGRPVVAVDVPSGLDCDLGVVSPVTIRALHTCTFVAAKPGFYLPDADAYTGTIHVLDIGAPRSLVENALRQR
jgi:NAD(P)H-hydrate epimerase